jgi:hypothetical protein
MSFQLDTKKVAPPQAGLHLFLGHVRGSTRFEMSQIGDKNGIQEYGRKNQLASILLFC